MPARCVKALSRWSSFIPAAICIDETWTSGFTPVLFQWAFTTYVEEVVEFDDSLSTVVNLLHNVVGNLLLFGVSHPIRFKRCQ